MESLLLLIGVSIAIAGGIWLLVLAFREHILWGLGCLFVSPIRRSPISIAIGGWVFLEENFSGSPKAEACAGAVVE